MVAELSELCECTCVCAHTCVEVWSCVVMMHITVPDLWVYVSLCVGMLSALRAKMWKSWPTNYRFNDRCRILHFERGQFHTHMREAARTLLIFASMRQIWDAFPAPHRLPFAKCLLRLSYFSIRLSFAIRRFGFGRLRNMRVDIYILYIRRQHNICLYSYIRIHTSWPNELALG